ncbi:HalOD1 output domain-containing protein [Natronococcus roseus]|uniref:HalOD1 output domain-containing protein n=1 Tax=Natronococcus roseus TaxID=1052014 RepID=UPI00374C9E72
MTETLTKAGTEIHERIVVGVATLENVDPVALPPLFDAVDPDALEGIFADPESEAVRIGTVEFPYAGRTIRIEFDDEPVVRID